jgi:hypothetical protein
VSIVARVGGELGARCDPSRLAKLATGHAVPDVQGLGYLLELVGARAHADALVHGLAGRRFRRVLLAPARAARGARAHPRWRVRPNVVVEAET